MESREIGKLNLSIAPEALREIVGSGRLMELASQLAVEAAEQIAAQLVDHVAASALKGDGLKGGASASVAFIFEGGDFATVPPRPHFGIGRINEIATSPLQRIAASEVRG